VHSPKIERIEVVAIGDVNRAKLYYLRGRVGRKARVRERREGQRLSSAGGGVTDQPVDESVDAERDPEGETEAETAPVEPTEPR
jgi:large subunit ribosomal protein L19